MISERWASANLDTSLYTMKTNCVDWVDPINVGFYGPGGFWTDAAMHVQHHLFWDDQGGTKQTNISHGTCYYMGTQRASASKYLSRWHVRFFYAHDEQGIYYTVGDAHYDQTVWCGHAVPPSGFDNARNYIRDGMSVGHAVYGPWWWGNTQPIKQCNGDRPFSDGNTWWVYM